MNLATEDTEKALLNLLFSVFSVSSVAR